MTYSQLDYEKDDFFGYETAELAGQQEFLNSVGLAGHRHRMEQPLTEVLKKMIRQK